MATAATLFLCLYFPVPLIMLWLHGLRRVWTRLGMWSYALHAPVYLAIVAVLVLRHTTWPAGAWPWPAGLRVAGGMVLAGGFVVLALTYRDIDTWTLMAGPEITRAPRRLITTGVYRHVRHPRYALLIAGAFGNFLLTGYPLLLVAAGATTLLTVLLVRVEEVELAEHFGDAWHDYAARVPGVLPRIGRKNGSGRTRQGPPA